MKKANTDFYKTDKLLLPEERAVRKSVREFVNKEFMPIVEECWRDEKFPTHLIPKIAKIDLFGVRISEKYGGADMNHVTYGLVNQELERGDSGLQLCVLVQNSLTMHPIFMFGSEEQKMHWLPKMAKGEVIACFGLTETNAGSNPAQIETTAKKNGNYYILNGTKMWITNGEIAHLAIVWARTEDGNVKGFLVPTDTPGFFAGPAVPHGNKTAIRISVTSELVLQHVKVHKDNMLPGADKLGTALQCLTQGRYAIACGVMGAAMACYEAAHNHAMNREQFGKPLAAKQLIQQKLVEMSTELTLAQVNNIHVGRMLDKGELGFEHVSMLKYNNTKKALKIADMAGEILGGNNIDLGYHVSRHFNNLKAAKGYEGAADIQLLTIGRAITGINAF